MTELNKIIITTRKITRWFAVPILILWWCLQLCQAILTNIACLLDLKPDEMDFCIEDLFYLIRNYLKDGANSL